MLSALSGRPAAQPRSSGSHADVRPTSVSPKRQEVPGLSARIGAHRHAGVGELAGLGLRRGRSPRSRPANNGARGLFRVEVQPHQRRPNPGRDRPSASSRRAAESLWPVSLRASGRHRSGLSAGHAFPGPRTLELGSVRQASAAPALTPRRGAGRCGHRRPRRGRRQHRRLGTQIARARRKAVDQAGNWARCRPPRSSSPTAGRSP